MLSMWARKSVAERNVAKRRARAVVAAAWLGVILVVLAGFAAESSAIALFNGALAAGLIVMAFGLRHQNKSRIVMCERCHHPRIHDGHRICACGGDLVDLAEMRWAEPGASYSSDAFHAAADAVTSSQSATPIAARKIPGIEFPPPPAGVRNA